MGLIQIDSTTNGNSQARNDLLVAKWSQKCITRRFLGVPGISSDPELLNGLDETQMNELLTIDQTVSRANSELVLWQIVSE